MNSGTSPPSARGGRALLAAPPISPAHPGGPFSRAALLPVGNQQSPPPPLIPPPSPPLPSRALGWTVSRVGGVERSTVWGADAEGGAGRRGVSSEGAPGSGRR